MSKDVLLQLSPITHQFLSGRGANVALNHIGRIFLFATVVVVLIDRLNKCGHEGFQQATDYIELDHCSMPQLGTQQQAGWGDGGAECLTVSEEESHLRH